MKTINNTIKSIYLLMPLFFIMAACENEPEPEIIDDPKVTIDLIESDSYIIFDKLVILYEDDKYLIKSPLFYFISDLGNIIHDYEMYLAILEKIISDGKNEDCLKANDYFSEHRMEYVLANFLESGNCHIKDKGENESIPNIVMETWGDSPAPLVGAGGRKFYINNELFLKTTDWVS